MSIQEYVDEKKDINLLYEREVFTARSKRERSLEELNERFALSRDVVSLGDVVSSGDSTIIVKEKTVSMSEMNIPIIVYSGLLLNKVGSSYEVTGIICDIPQTKVVSINERSYAYAPAQ